MLRAAQESGNNYHLLGCRRQSWNMINGKEKSSLLVHSEDEDTIVEKKDFQNFSKFPLPPVAPLSYPYFVGTSVYELHDQLYRRVFDTILNHGLFFNEPLQEGQVIMTTSPFQFRSRHDLKQLFDFSLPERRVKSENELVDIVQKVLEFSPKASHPYRVDRNASGLDPYGVMSDWLATALSAIVLVYHMGPLFTLMEFEVERKVRELVGYPGALGCGVIAPGNGMANGYVIQMALQSKFPQIKDKGLYGPEPVLFVSEHGYFAFERYCIWEGIGVKGCVRVAVDSKGRMCLVDLEKKILLAKENGQVPFLVVSTCGTTVLGAIDPIEEVAEIAHRYDMWFHVDAHLASGLILNPSLRRRIPGIEKSDSFLWACDVALSLPHTSTVLVTREKNAANVAFSCEASYVFQQSVNRATWDKGDFTLQCTRRPEVLKIWMAFKVRGQNQLSSHIEYTLKIKRQAVAELKRRSDAFYLILEEFESGAIAFYYKPRAVRGLKKSEMEKIMKAIKYTEKLQARLLTIGAMSISVQSISSPSFPQAPFFLMSLRNSAIQPAGIWHMLDRLEDEGENEEFLHEIGFFDCLNKELNLTNKIIKNGLKCSVAKRSRSNPISRQSQSHPEFVSAPIKQQHKNLMTQCIEQILKSATYFENHRGDPQAPPLLYKTPEDLMKLFDVSLANSLDGMSEEEFSQVFQKVIDFSAHLGHPYYNQHLVHGLDPHSLMADYVVTSVNSPMLTYEDSPLFTLMEEEVGLAVRRLIGYPDDGATLIIPGGSGSIQVAMELAYVRKFPEAIFGGTAASSGMGVAFISEAAHFAHFKGAFFMGIGRENCVQIPTNENGHMNCVALKEAVQKCLREGKKPFHVTATSGTTVFGVFDDLNEIADICEEFDMHLHVDASYGGSLLFSNDKKRIERLLKGVQRSDSLNVNPHKVFGAAKSVSVLVTREKKAFTRFTKNGKKAEQNGFHDDDHQNCDTDIGHLFPERRADVFKFWFMWKAKGREGLGHHVDYCFDLMEPTVKEILKRKGSFHLANHNGCPEFIHVNLYYVPKSLRHLNRQSEEFRDKIRPVTAEIHRRMMATNLVVLTTKNLGDLPPYFILSLTRPNLTFDDVLYFLNLIEHLGRDL